mgnify:CR=1 FL=1
MTNRSHDDIELRIAEALTGEAPLDASLQDHLQACASCTALVRALKALDGVKPGNDDGSGGARRVGGSILPRRAKARPRS